VSVDCPECGGKMRYDPPHKQYSCLSCGLSLTYQELMEIREKKKDLEPEEEKRKRERNEYLKWWLSKKE
jgi:DNA-directed RNA polymerase subunit RPC12/RpoP